MGVRKISLLLLLLLLPTGDVLRAVLYAMLRNAGDAAGAANAGNTIDAHPDYRSARSKRLSFNDDRKASAGAWTDGAGSPRFGPTSGQGACAGRDSIAAGRDDHPSASYGTGPGPAAGAEAASDDRAGTRACEATGPTRCQAETRRG